MKKFNTAFVTITSFLLGGVAFMFSNRVFGFVLCVSFFAYLIIRDYLLSAKLEKFEKQKQREQIKRQLLAEQLEQERQTELVKANRRQQKYTDTWLNNVWGNK